MINNEKWISNQANNKTTYADYFTKKFELKKHLKSAKIYISCLGVYKIFINGEDIYNDALMPYWVDYDKRTPKIEYNISKFIGQKNCIGIIVGNGWYSGYLGWDYKKNHYGVTPSIKVKIILEYIDKTTEEIISNEEWFVSGGEILENDLLNGENIDARLKIENFSKSNCDTSDMKKATILERVNILEDKEFLEKTVYKHSITPKLLLKKDNLIIFDVGQNIAGIAEIKIKAKSGVKLYFRYGEMLNQDNSLYVENLRKAKCLDTYICNGESEETFKPLFTFHGFRFIEISSENDYEILEITALAISSDLIETGNFNCSDSVVNKIFNNALWSQRSNFIGLPTDCPQRDERLGWSGDAQIFCLSAMYNMNCKKFFEKYLLDLRDSQKTDGAIAPFAPCLSGVDCYGLAGWGDAIAIIPYFHYQMYQDKNVIKDNITAIKKWIVYCLVNSKDLIRANEGFGDWLSCGKKTTDLSVLSTLYFAYSALICGKMCRTIEDKDELFYVKLYEKIKKSFLEKYVDKNNIILSDTQTVYLLAYKFGILNKGEIEANLLRTLTEENNHLSTGFIGVKFLLPTLCDIGHSDLAYELITKTTYPSWGYSVVNGATTIWERWNSYTIENGFGDTAMNSFNHYSLGSCVEWLYQYVLGIRPDENFGFSKIILKPYIDTTGKITSAKGSYQTESGNIEVSWKSYGKTAEYEILSPNESEIEYSFDGYDIMDIIKNEKKKTFILKIKNKE